MYGLYARLLLLAFCLGCAFLISSIPGSAAESAEKEKKLTAKFAKMKARRANLGSLSQNSTTARGLTPHGGEVVTLKAVARISIIFIFLFHS